MGGVNNSWVVGGSCSFFKKYIFEGSNQDLSLSDEQVNEINELVKERDDARNSGDYDRADKIRDKLSKMNVSIKDVNGKTEWEIL